MPGWAWYVIVGWVCLWAGYVGGIEEERARQRKRWARLRAANRKD